MSMPLAALSAQIIKESGDSHRWKKKLMRAGILPQLRQVYQSLILAKMVQRQFEGKCAGSSICRPQ